MSFVNGHSEALKVYLKFLLFSQNVHLLNNYKCHTHYITESESFNTCCSLHYYFIDDLTICFNIAQNEEECKVADLCIHDKVPMCGIDSCGEMRTFIDTCDMHEFNCDSKKGILYLIFISITYYQSKYTTI